MRCGREAGPEVEVGGEDRGRVVGEGMPGSAMTSLGATRAVSLGDLGFGQGGGGRNGNQACPDRAEIENGEGEGVAEAEENAVSGRQAEGLESGGGGSGKVEEVGVAECFLTFGVKDCEGGFVQARRAGEDVDGKVEDPLGKGRGCRFQMEGEWTAWATGSRRRGCWARAQWLDYRGSWH